ncbi:MAG: hypothetical protein RMI45_00950 [Ignisphaera sp.]|nr:hypothetical protein [Ignisphaera sp.]MDW8084794.1 hypothetical protein [Ignisphaera sp.]
MAGRMLYLCKIFERRYGVIGRVARRYLMAGYSVEFMHPTRYGSIHIIARRGSEKIAVEVFEKPSSVTMDTATRLLEKSRLVGAKPLLVLYSSGPRMDSTMRNYCAENGIRIRRIRD